MAAHQPFDIKDTYAIIYYPPVPRAVLEVVDPDNPFKVVPYDVAEREPPCDTYPWDGVRNVRPFATQPAPMTEGVYSLFTKDDWRH